MPEPYRNLIDPPLVRAAADVLRRTWPAFPARRFVALAADGLEALAMKARAMRIADALEATLPGRFADAAAVLEAALAAPGAGDDAVHAGEGLAGWVLWGGGEFVARRGLAEPDRALRTLHALTQRFTAEFAIRPFVVAHPALVFATLERWCADPSWQVRRLVSEGTRPRLPWGLRLQALVQDPSPTLPLLHALQDDPSEDVRRSVANHLNDIAKDHPAVVADWLERWLPGAPPERRALLRHACRTLVKQGDGRVLQALGVGRALHGELRLAVAPARLVLGGALTLTLDLHSTSRRPQALAIDYAVHHAKADGRLTPKVFKGWVLELPALGTRTLVRRHAIRPITTRRYHPGRHAVDVRVNGRVVAEAGFTLAVEGASIAP